MFFSNGFESTDLRGSKFSKTILKESKVEVEIDKTILKYLANPDITSPFNRKQFSLNSLFGCRVK